MRKFSKITAVTVFVAVGSMALSVMAASSTTVGVQKAKAIALEHAKLSEKDVTFTKAYMDTEDGISVYEVEFYHGGTEYDYEVESETGKIREFSKEEESLSQGNVSDKDTSNTVLPESGMSIEQAKEVALSHAQLSGEEVTFTKAELDSEDGVTVYEIEFYQGGKEYNYEINATTKQVVDFEIDNDLL